jgi:uncharacterized protein involved in oxidation of intracellular sulfur
MMPIHSMAEVVPLFRPGAFSISRGKFAPGEGEIHELRNCRSLAEPEIVWNAFRFAGLLRNENDEMGLFRDAPAVRHSEGDPGTFPIGEQTKIFALSEGALLA